MKEQCIQQSLRAMSDKCLISLAFPVVQCVATHAVRGGGSGLGGGLAREGWKWGE